MMYGPMGWCMSQWGDIWARGVMYGSVCSSGVIHWPVLGMMLHPNVCIAYIPKQHMFNYKCETN